jgi:DNA processing protein
MSVGCHLLLADRFAQLVTSADDVLTALGRLPNGNLAIAARALEPSPGTDPRHPTDGLDLDSARVYDAFHTYQACTVDELVAESGLSAQQVLGSLAMLDLHGLAVKEGTIWRRLRPSDTRE